MIIDEEQKFGVKLKDRLKEIAEILNLTETNAKVKLYRILEKVKKTLTKINKHGN
jgi:transcription-repair coupling factor (superfamily II helicase)